ncbi:transmembrane protein 63C [Aspergillus pseudoviridinutans]|uniref:Transmembrane protein 63C n=1 Tax=Aspergillus pseudoviridinutans TaxID=1517512 RepID=A0A9P3ERL2_9EURO|nr:transmembrane protein 63C [Aspergillus pseudoviridinutans]GIJ85179.1 transmembrane protein 63C [Aspergillus pseudoviridinutans]
MVPTIAVPVWVGPLVKRQNFLDPNNDPNIGSSRGNASSTTSDAIAKLSGVSDSTSLSALVTTLLPALVIALFWFGLFLICRRTQLRCERSPELPRGFINWFGQFLKISDAHVLHSSSMDGYLFLRFLRVLSSTCFTGCLITWPILIPIHVTGGAGNTQLDALSFSNVKDPTRYYAHAIMACVLFTYVFYVVTRESLFYANLRQAYLNSPAYVRRISSRTVLFMSVPEDYKNEPKLRQVFGDSIRKIWITSDCKELMKKVNKRDNFAYRLEKAETNFIRAANSARLKAFRNGVITSDTCLDCEGGTHSWRKKIRRPGHRVKLFGPRVDSIQWLRDELVKVSKEVEDLQEQHQNGEMKNLSALFIEFNTQSDAQIALQTLSHHQPLHMTPRFIGISPKEVVWSSLNLSWWQRIVRKFAVQGGIAALVIFWSIPAAAVGAISNITYLTKLLPFLRFIDKLPSALKGVIAGLLPSAALVLLMSLVPIICRFLARRAGAPSTAHVELFTQSAHFCFQVVQVFLVTTLTSAASAATAQIIKNPLSAKDLLAQNLPKATNFYISYFLLQGLTMSSMALVQVAGVIIFKFMSTFFDRSPRLLYQRWAALSGIGWGNVFPAFTNMGVIGLYLVYQAYRYNFLFVYDIGTDTKGLVYPRALQHLLTGIYLADICMIGLFAIRAAIGPLIIMALFTILTVLAHMSLNEALAPLYTFLPRTLDTEEEEQQSKEEETQALLQHPRNRWEAAWKWFHPNLYSDYAALRRKVRRDHVEIRYSEAEERNAYFEPCIWARTPTLWIPRDKWGFSHREVLETHPAIPITDEGAHLDEKNKIVWDKYDPSLPLWELKVLY